MGYNNLISILLEGIMSSEKVKKMLASQLNIDVKSISDSSRIVEDLGADSLDMMEMLMGLESEYSITIPDEVAENLKTVGDVARFLDKQAGKNSKK